MKFALVQTTHDHLPALFDQKNCPDVLTWIPGDYPLDYDQFIEKPMAYMAGGHGKHQTQFTIMVDDSPAGMIGHFEREGENRYEIGYYIGKDYWGKGVTSFAVKTCVEEIRKFGATGPLYGCHASENVASGRVLEKAGFLPDKDIPFTLPDGTVVMDKSWRLDL